MKPLIALLACILPCTAQDTPADKPVPAGAPTGAPSARPVESADSNATPVVDPAAFQPFEANFLNTPQVRVDVLMVSMPEARALAMLPELRDPGKIEAAQAKILEMIGRKEATLVDWPEVTTHDGNRAVSETIVEMRYPMEFSEQSESPLLIDSKTKKESVSDEALKILRAGGFAVPQEFGVRNVGTSIEAHPTVSPDGSAVTLQIAPQAVALLRTEEHVGGKDAAGKPVMIKQPVFTTRKISTNVTLRDGERRLLYFGKPVEPDGRVDLFIVGVKIILPVGKK
jgi:hypothetical protein